MARQIRQLSATGIYHVLMRGINRQRIFEDAQDYTQFLTYLSEVKEQTGFALFAYCLLDNHVHLLIKEKAEPLSRVFLRLGVR
jgi:REP element-mobilizing transposase RayT